MTMRPYDGTILYKIIKKWSIFPGIIITNSVNSRNREQLSTLTSEPQLCHHVYNDFRFSFVDLVEVSLCHYPGQLETSYAGPCGLG